MKVWSWIENHIIFTIIISVVVIGSAVITPIIIANTKETSKKEYKTTIELSENLNFEINSETYLVSLIKKISNGELLTENYKIDTSKLGIQELIIKYLDENQIEKEYKFNINVVDTIAPVIEYTKELSTTLGNKIDLLKGVKVTDNSLEEVKVNVEGKYDFNKIGTYKLKYIAVDSSNNKKEEEFILNVKNIALKTTGYYARKTSVSWSQISFKNDNTYNYQYLGCPGPACGVGDWIDIKGKYRIDGNKIIVNIPNTFYESTDSLKVTHDNTWEFTIVDKNKLKINKDTFTWNSTDIFYIGSVWD